MSSTESLKQNCSRSVVLRKGGQVLVLRMDTSLVKTEDATLYIHLLQFFSDTISFMIALTGLVSLIRALT